MTHKFTGGPILRQDGVGPPPYLGVQVLSTIRRWLFPRRHTIQVGHAPHILVWIDSVSGGRVFKEQAAALAEHDPSCSSIKSAWLPRTSGHSNLHELYLCDGGCNTTFWVEGVVFVDSCPLAVHWYCACCTSRNPVCDCASREGDPI